MKIKLLYIGNILSKHGFSPTTIETLGPLLQQEFDVHLVSNKKSKFLRILDMWFSIIKNRTTVDYIVIDTYSSSAYYFALSCGILSHFLGLKYIPILHGGNLETRIHKSSKLTNTFFRNAFILVSPSGFLKHIFEKHGYSNIIVIPNNIQIENYNFRQRSIISPKLLWVRSFADFYNPELAIYILKKLLKNYPESQLCFVGPDKDGTQKKCIALTEELELQKNIIFTGKLPKTDWLKLAQDYDIFISTTNIDNTPVSVIEAMALGMIVISTNVGGVPYVIANESNGHLFEANNIEDGTNKILNILQQSSIQIEQNKIMSENARKTAETWDWKAVRLKWLDVLK
jgi:glycosyltransferase involved in cell wall biosynthesis